MMLLFCIPMTSPLWRFRTRFLFISLLVSPATCTPSGRLGRSRSDFRIICVILNTRFHCLFSVA